MRKRFPIIVISGFGFTMFGLTLQSCHKTSSHNHCEAEGVVVEQSYVHSYGVNVEKQDWAARGENGQVITTLKTGVTVTKHYREGVLEGDITYTFPHTTVIQKVETYGDGELLKVVENYPSGHQKTRVVYLSPTEVEVTSWYEHGAVRSQETVQEDKLQAGEYYTSSGKVEGHVIDGTGKRINRDNFGQLVSTDDFRDGELAQRVTYYPNGSPKEVTPYVYGEISGLKKTFFPGGEPQSTEQWEKNQQHGLTVVYQNGEKIGEITYVNGVKHGKEYRYRDGEFLAEEINWENGVQEGISRAYIGEKTHQSWYIKGKEVTKSQYDRYMKPLMH